MIAFRMTQRRMFVPGVGVVPYIRYLHLNRRGERFFFKVKGPSYTTTFTVYEDDYRTAFINALEEIENIYGLIRTGTALRKHERKDKKNPTGYVGIYNFPGLAIPYQVTCPYETNEYVGSLMKAIMIREQARDEYERKNILSVPEILSMAAKEAFAHA